MATPSFSEFQWPHIQPSWAYEPDYATAIRTARFERWAPLWKLLLSKPEFSDYEVGALLRLKDEYEGGVGRKG
jgi:hypothetical protein